VLHILIYKNKLNQQYKVFGHDSIELIYYKGCSHVIDSNRILYNIVPTSFLCFEVVGLRRTLNLNLVLITKNGPIQKIVSLYATEDHNKLVLL